MSTYTARKLLNQNVKTLVNPQKDPALYNLSAALIQLSRAIDELDAKIVHVSKQVASSGTRPLHMR